MTFFYLPSVFKEKSFTSSIHAYFHASEFIFDLYKKADKSSTIVILNREDYIAEVERQLNDQTYYEKLHEDPHEEFKKEMQDTISEYQDNQILQGFGNVSIPNENKVPQFYVLPNTHKPYNPIFPLGYPDRPIVSACGYLTENVSAFIDSTLKQYMESYTCNPHTLKTLLTLLTK